MNTPSQRLSFPFYAKVNDNDHDEFFCLWVLGRSSKEPNTSQVQPVLLSIILRLNQPSREETWYSCPDLGWTMSMERWMDLVTIYHGTWIPWEVQPHHVVKIPRFPLAVWNHPEKNGNPGSLDLPFRLLPPRCSTVCLRKPWNKSWSSGRVHCATERMDQLLRTPVMLMASCWSYFSSLHDIGPCSTLHRHQAVDPVALARGELVRFSVKRERALFAVQALKMLS